MMMWSSFLCGFAHKDSPKINFIFFDIYTNFYVFLEVYTIFWNIKRISKFGKELIGSLGGNQPTVSTQ
jgi:hypothetical protein